MPLDAYFSVPSAASVSCRLVGWFTDEYANNGITNGRLTSPAATAIAMLAGRSQGRAGGRARGLSDAERSGLI
jgi:hypothetical protein